MYEPLNELIHACGYFKIICPPMSRRFGIISLVKFQPHKILSLVALFGLAGCFSFETSQIGAGTGEGLRLRATEGAPVEHVVVANNGWFLFNCIPLACGDTDLRARLPWTLFRNNVHERVLHDRITRYAAEKKCDLEEMNVFNDEQVLLTLPGFSFPIPLPYVITYRELQISGVLVCNEPRAATDDAASRKRAISNDMKRLLDALPDGGSK